MRMDGTIEARLPVSERCIREHYGDEFIIPDLSDRFVRTGFALRPGTTDQLGIFYEPSSVDDVDWLRIDVFPQQDAVLGGDARFVTLSNGERLYLYELDGGAVVGNVFIRGVAYSLAMGLDVTDSDTILTEIAEQMVAQAS